MSKKKKRKLKTPAGEQQQQQQPKEELDDEENIEISIWKENVKISDSVPNVEAWVTGSSLQIDSCSFNIIVNIRSGI